jgi:hypothetical protein
MTVPAVCEATRACASTCDPASDKLATYLYDTPSWLPFIVSSDS